MPVQPDCAQHQRDGRELAEKTREVLQVDQRPAGGRFQELRHVQHRIHHLPLGLHRPAEPRVDCPRQGDADGDGSGKRGARERARPRHAAREHQEDHRQHEQSGKRLRQHGQADRRTGRDGGAGQGVPGTASHTASSNRTMSAVSTWSATRRPAASAMTKPFTAWNDAASSPTRRSNSVVPIRQVSRIAAVAKVMDGSRIAMASRRTPACWPPSPTAPAAACAARRGSSLVGRCRNLSRAGGRASLTGRPAGQWRRALELLVPAMQRPLPAGIEPQQAAGEHDERERHAGARGVHEPGRSR